MNKGTFTGVGLGPGEPELITLKGYRALQGADIIFYPVSSLEDGQCRSFSLHILNKLEINKPCEPLLFPMKGKGAQKFYEEAFTRIKNEYKDGKNVVLVSEGDLFFYSTFGYIFKLAKEENIPCHLVPGVPAFIAASTLGNQPLVESTTGLEIIAKPESFEAVTEVLKRQSTLVIMKISVLNNWHLFLKNCGHSFLYAERVGTDSEFFTSNANELEFRQIPYFSLLIIYPKFRN
ncbi:MAG: precorrin-2 C(20)-methyltransferase [Draconibacterium sp.]|nr:MAG: precorrin-2 C(20)-methyltransferase [Draconibacterium sp.]PIF06568.1 MAG: precorrin-2 C(20)-methyltransferase [Draconibacterium sp.]